MASAFKSRLKMRRDSKLLLLKPKILLQTALILSCFTTCLCQSKIQEILVDGDLNNFSPNLVRHPRDVSQGSHDVSSLAYPTKLNSSHLHLMVHWAGEGSPVIFVLARSQVMDKRATSKTFISKDYGKNFKESSHLFKLETDENAVIAKFYHHPQSNCHYVFADTINNYVFTSTDCGENIQAHKLDTINPSRIAFDKNRDNVFLIHDLENPKKRLHVTKTFGQTFGVVQDYVRNFFFDEAGEKLFVERIQPDVSEEDMRVNILASNNFFERRIDTENIYRNAVQFQILGKYMFVTKYAGNDKKHLDLFVSMTGEKFVQARFPYSEDKNYTILDYHIIDVTEDGEIMVVANHGPVLSNLYTSAKITPYEVQFSLSLERVMFYNPNVTWHDSWLAATAGDQPFADVYKIQGLRGIYVASQIINIADPTTITRIEPANLKSLISFDQGGMWIPIKGPKTDEEGRNFTDCQGSPVYRCNLHLSQQLSQKFPTTRSIPIMSSKSAIGMVVGSGNMGQTLKQRNNVFVSADAGLSWHQVLKGSYYFNMGDHGGILVATQYYKTEGPTNELLYSTNEGITWKPLKFYAKKLKVYGLLTEPGENSTTFTVFGTENGASSVNWIIVTVDLKSVFERNCTTDDYKRWSPNDSTLGKHRNCLLGRKKIYERRMVRSDCYNGRDYERVIAVENCACDKSDFQCDFGFKQDDSWSTGCVKDPKFHHDPYEPPSQCPSGEFYNLTRGYVKIRGDTCEGGHAKVYEPQKVACPMTEEKEFLLLSKRDKILRINLKNLTDQEELPLENVENVISIEYEMEGECVFYGDTDQRKIFKQCLNGSAAEVLVHNTQTVEGMSFDWISKTLYFVDGSKKTIELVRVDVKSEGRMRKTILDDGLLTKPRGIAVHPLHGHLFYSDWNEENPHIGRTDMDGSNRKVLFSKPVVQWPNGLSLDYVANRLYWIDAKKDTISSCRYDGSDFKVVMERKVQMSHPFGLTIHKNLVFWDDWTHHALFKADKNTGMGIASIVSNIKGGMEVKAFSYLHRQGTNACSKKPCSHICVPLPGEKFTCLCPDGLKAINNTDDGKISCKCTDGSDELSDGTCAQQDGTCSVDQFTCANGKCIPNNWKCDGNNDCGDKSDESDLRCNKLNCRPTEFKCLDEEKCIPEKWRCDFDQDCRDGSDENCTHATCPADQFRCTNGQCIAQKWRCDLEIDCQDGTDEEDCGDINHPNVNDSTDCKANEFKCNNSPQCLPSGWQCDGDFDCPGKEDEEGCDEAKCQDWQFDCGEGQCIFKSWRCDGEKDCSTGADEQNCTDIMPDESTEQDGVFDIPYFPNSTQCNEWTFKCTNGQCIPYWWKCDGSKDCSDQSDELECENPDDVPEHPNDDNENNDPSWTPTCSEDKFLCPGSSDCIWEAWLCDHEDDCPGGEDESKEVCADRPICDKNMFRCEQSGECVNYEQICDRHVDCPDGSDEIGCSEETFEHDRTCPNNEFPCDADQCIPDSKICDGFNDCMDGSDEYICSKNHPQVLHLQVLADNVNATSVQVDWQLAHEGSEDQISKILYQPAFAPEGTNDWTYEAWQKLPLQSYIFKNLQAFTTYKFAINLKTEKGVVYNSTHYAKTTTMPAMPTKPRIYKVSQSGTNIILRWTRPSTSNGPLKNYIIEMSTDGFKNIWETQGPVDKYVLEASQFNPGQILTFRVQAVNSLFNGEFSDEYKFSIEHSVIEDTIENIQVASKSDSKVIIKWSKVTPKENSALNNGSTWFYRVSYSILKNQFAIYEDLQVDNSADQVEVKNLSPGSTYTFRFNVQMGPMSGPSVLLKVKTTGKTLPKPEITEANLVPTSGTTIKLTWKLSDDDAKNNEGSWNYAIYYGMKMTEIISEGPRLNTTQTTAKVTGLHACESYSFVVAIIGPKGYGPPSNPVSTSTKFAAGAPPKNLQSQLNRSNNEIKLSWDSSCSVIDQPIGYVVTYNDLTTDQGSRIMKSKTVDTKLSHTFKDTSVKYGTEYRFTVNTDVANAQLSNEVTVKTVDLPIPEALSALPNLNMTYHDIRWREPKNLPKYLQNDHYKKNKLSYRLLISSDPHFKKPELTYNLTDTKYELRMEKLEAGKIYYVGVSLVDDGKYVSSRAGPIPLESPIPPKDMIVSPSGVAGVLVPIFIVIAILGSALGYYMHRNRRLKRNFMAFASRYSPATGAAILNAADLDDDDDSPIIRGFADDEPLVVS